LYDMLEELDKYVLPGTCVSILANVPVDERQSMLEDGKAGPLMLEHIQLEHVYGSTTYRRDIDAIMRARTFSSVLVLAAEGGGGGRGTSTSAADSRALTTLLLVKDVRQTLMHARAHAVHTDRSAENGTAPPDMAKALAKAPAAAPAIATGARRPSMEQQVIAPQSEDFTLLGEIMSDETKDLVAATGVSDYIMSNRLMSKVMAMVAEEDSVGPLFEQLFAEEGDEIYVRDVRCYCTIGEALSFWELASRARVRGDIAIGFKRGQEEVTLNPPNKTVKMAWCESDFLIIIGDDNPDP